MSFWKKLPCFCGVNIVLVVLTLGINPFRFSNPIAVGLIITVPTTIVISYLLYELKEQRIWYVPLSQIALCVCVCVVLIARDLLGLRRSGGFIDFGVGFDVTIVIILAAFWVIPSLFASFVYARLMKRRDVSSSYGSYR